MFALLRICLNSSRCMRFMFFIIDTFTQQLFIPLLNILQKLQNFFSKKGNFHQVTSQQAQLSPNVFSQHCRLAYLSSLFVCFSKLVFNKIKFLMEDILQPFFLKVQPQQGASLAGCILSKVYFSQYICVSFISLVPRHSSFSSTSFCAFLLNTFLTECCIISTVFFISLHQGVFFTIYFLKYIPRCKVWVKVRLGIQVHSQVHPQQSASLAGFILNRTYFSQYIVASLARCIFHNIFSQVHC